MTTTTKKRVDERMMKIVLKNYREDLKEDF